MPLPQNLASLVERARKGDLPAPQIADLIEKLKALTPSKIRERVDAGLLAFAEQSSGGKWKRAKHLEVLAAQLEAMDGGLVKRQLVSMPPRHGKSELISFWFPIWLLAKNPSRKIILASYEHEFATFWGRRVRDFIRDEGHSLGLELNQGVTAAHNWQLTTGGGMICAGAGGPITGKGADILIIDDPIKNSEEASSETIRESLWNWWQTTAFTRLDSHQASVVMVATRWHEDDLLGRLERQSRSGEGLAWEILKLPALAESDDFIGRELNAPLWPERLPLEMLLAIKNGMSPYNWSALYQQRPSPEEGGGVRRKWWQWYGAYPDLDAMDVVIQSWDLAFKDLKKSDYTVGQVWARKGASLYLIDQIRGHMNAEEVVMAVRAFTARYPRAIAKLIEDKANGPAVITMLQKKTAGVIPVKVKSSKDARLAAVVPLIAAANVHLPAPELVGNWVMEFTEECAAFPNGTNDDQVDAMTQALEYLYPGTWLAVDREHKNALEEVNLAKTVQEMQMRLVHQKLKKQMKKAEKLINKQSNGDAFRKTRVSGNW